MDTCCIELTPILSDDLPTLFKWINDREQVIYNSPYRPIHQKMHESWFESIQKRDDLVFFAIRNNITKNMVGTCQLHSINNTHRTAELQIRLGDPNERNKGIGTLAVKLLLEFGFRDLNLHRISLHVFSSNSRAIRVYEKAGFVREGVLRKAVYLNGSYEDVVAMGILRDEYFGS